MATACCCWRITWSSTASPGGSCSRTSPSRSTRRAAAGPWPSRQRSPPSHSGRPGWQARPLPARTRSPTGKGSKPPAARCRWTSPTGTNRFRDTAETVVALPADLGGLLLGAANRAYRTSPEDLLLAALARALRSWPGGERRERLVITLEGHGRHAHAGELGRTVGWFTDRYPFALELGDDGVASAVQIVKEARRRVPGGGAGYSRLRYPADGATGPPPGPALSFNYLGAVDLGAGDAFTVQLAFGWEASVDGDAVRPCELDASAIALNGRLELRLAYSRERLRARTVAALAERWQRELRVVGEHCAQRRAEVTPADLSYSSISLEDLEGIAS